MLIQGRGMVYPTLKLFRVSDIAGQATFPTRKELEFLKLNGPCDHYSTGGSTWSSS
jgi:hypothetical protein